MAKKDPLDLLNQTSINEEINKSTNKNINTGKKSSKDQSLVRVSRFHRELVKQCSRAERMRIDELIDKCIETYCKENHPKLYKITIELMKII